MTPPSARTSAQAVAQQLGLSPDDALFLQTVPNTLLAALVRGEVNLPALARAELADRGLDLRGQWVGFDMACEQLAMEPAHVDAFVTEEQARVEAFRTRWHEAHRINPEQYRATLPFRSMC